MGPGIRHSQLPSLRGHQGQFSSQRPPLCNGDVKDADFKKMSSEKLCQCKLGRFQNFVRCLFPKLHGLPPRPLPPNIYLSIHASNAIYGVRTHLVGTPLVFFGRKNILWQSTIISLYSRGWQPVAHRLFLSNVLLGHTQLHPVLTMVSFLATTAKVSSCD